MQNKTIFSKQKRLFLYSIIIIIGIILVFLFLQSPIIKFPIVEKEAKKFVLKKEPVEEVKTTDPTSTNTPKADVLQEGIKQITDEILIKSVKIKPTNPTLADSLKTELELLSNPSDKNITLKYDWRINGNPVEGVLGDVLPPGKIKKGDYVNLVLEALKDGKTLQRKNSNFVLVQNSPPTLSIRVLKNTVRIGQPIEIQLTSTDPDGDKIAYSLEEAPSTVSFDPVSGRINYYPYKVGSESIKIRVSAIDTDGAKTTAVFDVHVGIIEAK